MISYNSSTSTVPALAKSNGPVMPPGRTGIDTRSHRPAPQNSAGGERSSGPHAHSDSEKTTASPALSADAIARNQIEKARQMSTLESVVRAMTTSPDGPPLAEVSPAPTDHGARKYEQNLDAVRTSVLEAQKLRSPGDVADLRI